MNTKRLKTGGNTSGALHLRVWRFFLDGIDTFYDWMSLKHLIPIGVLMEISVWVIPLGFAVCCCFDFFGDGLATQKATMDDVPEFGLGMN